jgi:DNA gyrase inhibitor GyrI
MHGGAVYRLAQGERVIAGRHQRDLGRVVGRSRDHPADDFRFDICGSVSEPIAENAFGVVNGTIPGGRCAVARHHGSLDTLAQSVWSLYRDWLPTSGETLRDFPLFFRYLNFA